VFSVDVLVLLAAIYQITKMSYSRTHQCTYLSYYPYYTIIAYSAFEATQILFLIGTINTVGKDFENVSTWVFKLSGTSSVGKFVCYTVFVAQQVYEWYCLQTFIVWQSDLSLAKLQVKRSEF
jgi:hypothetical protein